MEFCQASKVQRIEQAGVWWRQVVWILVLPHTSIAATSSWTKALVDLYTEHRTSSRARPRTPDQSRAIPCSLGWVGVEQDEMEGHTAGDLWGNIVYFCMVWYGVVRYGTITCLHTSL